MGMYKDLSYKEVIEIIKANSCCFRCTSDDKFMQSLLDDNYDGWRLTKPRSYIEKRKNSALTEVYSSGFMYIEERDCYYEIEIHRIETDLYEVIVDYCPMLMMQDDKGNITTKIK